jgi:hypothetical protein
MRMLILLLAPGVEQKALAIPETGDEIGGFQYGRIHKNSNPLKIKAGMGTKVTEKGE